MEPEVHGNNQREQLKSITDLCEWLMVPRKTVYTWTSNRHVGFPFYKIGKHLRFRFSEVDSWIKKYHASEGAHEFNQTGSGKKYQRPGR